MTATMGARNMEQEQVAGPGKETPEAKKKRLLQSLEVFRTKSFASTGKGDCVSEFPSFDAVDGIKFDFCEGARILFPDEGSGWLVRILDADSDIPVYVTEVAPSSYVVTAYKWFVRYKIVIYAKADADRAVRMQYLDKMDYATALSQIKPVFEHEMSLEDKVVMFNLGSSAIGDTLAWFPKIAEFQEKHKCKAVAAIGESFIPLLEKQYPNVTILSKAHVRAWCDEHRAEIYAAYVLALFPGKTPNRYWEPCDFRLVGLAPAVAHILGVDPTPAKAKLDLSADRTIREPYVCIAAQGGSMTKMWLNRSGWDDVVQFLKAAGYRVICIDRNRTEGNGVFSHSIPFGCEDFTGRRPLQERIDVLKDADFFIGTSSGLSWLAWSCNIPVVLISGFTHPSNEFHTPYRVINYNGCNSCFNNQDFVFDNTDYEWCPVFKGTPRQFECSRNISGKMVIAAIQRIPGYQRHVAALGKMHSQP